VAEFEAQFVSLPGENFAFVPGSLFNSAGAEGSPLGANLAVLQQVMGGGGVPGGPGEVAPDPGYEPMRRGDRMIRRVRPGQ
jgi:hypothetical protein